MSFILTKQDELKHELTRAFERWIIEIAKEEGVSTEQKRKEFSILLGC